MPKYLTAKAYVQESSLPHAGLGVYAQHAIAAHECIEECACLCFPKDLVEPLEDYVFKIDDKRYLPLGLGAIYNHHEQPNAEVIFRPVESKMQIIALRAIHAHEEIFINYGQDWFQSRVRVAKSPLKWHHPVNMLAKIILVIIILSVVLFGAQKIFHLTQIKPAKVDVLPDLIWHYPKS